MKLRTIVILVAASLAVPAFALAQETPSPADRANAAQACNALRSTAQLGPETFKSTYGTNANKSNAFGVCVSKWARAEHQNRAEALAECTAERTADAAAFEDKYGQGKGAVARCASAKQKAARTAARAAVVRGAKACRTERTQMGATAFAAKYGGKANAFGRCVSKKSGI